MGAIDGYNVTPAASQAALERAHYTILKNPGTFRIDPQDIVKLDENAIIERFGLLGSMILVEHKAAEHEWTEECNHKKTEKIAERVLKDPRDECVPYNVFESYPSIPNFRYEEVRLAMENILDNPDVPLMPKLPINFSEKNKNVQSSPELLTPPLSRALDTKRESESSPCSFASTPESISSLCQHERKPSTDSSTFTPYLTPRIDSSLRIEKRDSEEKAAIGRTLEVQDIQNAEISK